ncbi:restriction endonuclease subunit S [Parabacteroides distasonis]|uniref:restriction endonuclease subunit S n=1 Tax=Parabacteroides distasonis TaxID=823 RepID=UPI000E4F60FA|nr:restriction endonuclease subunit S [Parabacteroides distasonis]MRZ46664.1 restriction endonuclease subunit S [Parabacteroides distasonis]MRZ59280.1 restriction endonuclease subunit S [Parabacteroides distasonis]RGI06249.1 restriction endonuclease subunit S [Bacteroides sp. AM25-34]
MRFPKFSGEWKREILNDVCTFHNGRAYKQNELLSDGKYRVLRVGNFFTNDSWYYSDLELDDEKVAVNGDLLYAWSASFGPRFWTGEKVIYHYHIWKIDSFQQVSKEFLFYFLERDTEKIKNEVQGGTMVHITKGDMEKREILYPSILEQSKIARLLSLLDERIATQNKIIEDLKKLKSAISLKMLHSDSWEQFRIKDIAIIGRGRVISSVEISQQKNPTYPVYSSQTSNEGIMGYLDDYMFEGEYISWTTDGANAGTVFYRNGRFNCTNVCGLLKLKKGFDTHFVSLVLAEATKKYVSVNLANPKLMNNTMGNIQICLPKLEEQKRISIVFRRLHELLAIHNNLLTEYSKQKQYLLSQMFI